jgi:type III pantothenate kinase
MLVAIDVGNSAVKFGAFDGVRLVATERVESGPTAGIAAGVIPFPHVQTADEVVVLSSAPEALRLLLGELGRPARVLGEEVQRAVPSGYARPQELGVDRIAAAYGARALLGGAPAVVVDAGTAITVDGVDADGRMVPLAIAPGLPASRAGLRSSAPHLPLPDLAPGPHAVPARGTAPDRWLGSRDRRGSLPGASGGTARRPPRHPRTARGGGAVSRSLFTLLDLGRDEIHALLDGVAVPARGAPLAGKVVAVLPFAAGSLPRAAWVAVAGRLGATVLRAEDLPAGADDLETCRRAARWADLLVVTHPLQGFSRAVAEETGCAVLNAGEGPGEDPVAGLSLLDAAVRSGSRSDSGAFRAAICGDLRGSASVHALLGGLAALEAVVLLVPARGKDLHVDALERLARRMHRRPVRFQARSMRSLLDMVDTVLLAPEEAQQLPLFRQVGVPPDEADRKARRQVEDLDVLVVASAGGGDRLVHEPFRRGRTSVPEGARHETGAAALGAALRFCLERDASGPREPDVTAGAYGSPLGLRCVGEDCVGARLPDEVAPDFVVLDRGALALECRHCGRRVDGAFAASRHEHRFHPAGSGDAGRILDENLVVFRTRGEALAAGFEPSRRKPAGNPGDDA